eukprot:COSAG04_NODE_19390_length_417_cov_1.113208_1_plen_68_part_10
MLLRASRGGGVTAEAGVSAPPIASAIAPRCAAGTVTFWDGALLHTGDDGRIVFSSRRRHTRFSGVTGV